MRPDVRARAPAPSSPPTSPSVSPASTPCAAQLRARSSGGPLGRRTLSAPGSGYDKPETILLHSAEEVETLLDVGPAAVK